MQPTLGIFNVFKPLRAREKIERKLARGIAPKLGAEDTVSTAFVLGKAEKELGEPQGKSTLLKLQWIADSEFDNARLFSPSKCLTMCVINCRAGG